MGVAPQPADANRAKLLAGEPLQFPSPPTDRDESPQEKSARTIPAKWLEELPTTPKRVVNVPIDIAYAIIEGPLNLEYATFEGQVSLVACKFGEAPDFSSTTFKRKAIFAHALFGQGANFDTSVAESHFDLRGAQFLGGEATFIDFLARGVFDASGAKFAPKVKANFNRAHFEKSAFFDGATFDGEADFGSARIGSMALFRGSQFKQTANFDSAQIDSAALFRTDDEGNQVHFSRQAIFRGAHIGGNTEFDGAQFGGTASFHGVRLTETFSSARTPKRTKCASATKPRSSAPRSVGKQAS